MWWVKSHKKRKEKRLALRGQEKKSGENADNKKGVTGGDVGKGKVVRNCGANLGKSKGARKI